MKFKALFILAAVLVAATIYAAPGINQQDTRSTWFSCTMISTATILTEITGCAAVAGQSYYITDVVWSSSIISTTVNFFLLQSGTGTACATATTSWLADFTTAAFGGNAIHFQTPIKVTAAHALCFIHPGAGTRNVTISGYRAV